MSFLEFSHWKNDMVNLRCASEDDWEPFYEEHLEGCFPFWRGRKDPCPEGKELARKQWKTLVEGYTGNVLAIEAQGKELAGYLEIGPVSWEDGIFSAWVFIRGESRRQGIATAALRLLADDRFHTRRMHKFYALLPDGQPAADALLRRIGCTREAVLPEMLYQDKEYRALAFYGLTVQGYEKNTVRKK